MRRAVDLLLACHPQPAAAVTVLAGVIAAISGRSALGVVLVVLAFGSGQLSVGWCNDWLDAARDAQVGRSDKPVAAGRVSVPLIRGAALGALAATVPLSLLLGPVYGGLHLLAVASAWSYDLGLKATVASFLPYAVSFGLLPSIAVGRVVPWWGTGAAVLLGVGAHLANALPDLDDDRRTGVQHLPLRLGPRRTAAMSAVALLAGTALLAFGPRGAVGVAGVVAIVAAAAVTAAGLLAGRAPGSRTPFLAAMAVAALDVALLLARSPQLR
jgi:4-hydroxybenzoate polyprenyltransferase